MAENVKFPPKVVVDASTILALLLPDEKIKSSATKILQQHAQGELDFLSTRLLDFEVVNGIRSAILTKRISEKIGKKLVSNFLKLKIEKRGINFEKAFGYSLRFSISVYDAGYLTLAKRTNLPLVTCDKKTFSKS